MDFYTQILLEYRFFHSLILKSPKEFIECCIRQNGMYTTGEQFKFYQLFNRIQTING